LVKACGALSLDLTKSCSFRAMSLSVHSACVLNMTVSDSMELY